MRVLSVHNEYLIKGGEDESRRAEIAVLEQYGHEVLSYVENNTKIAQLGKVRAALRTIWSQDSYNYVKRLLKEKKYDIIHVQNFFPLISPSIYYAAHEAGVPVVQAVRNYRFLCPNATLYRDGHICEQCLKKSVKLPAVQHNCYRNNKAASATAVAMHLLHSYLPSWRYVNQFVCVSEFVKSKMVEGGYPAHKITVKPNFVFPDPGLSVEKEDYLVYVGRLQEEKGIRHLLEALQKLPRTLPVRIIGEGPLEAEVRACAEKCNISYLGKLPLAETYNIIGKARALVIPSVWHEPFGRVVVEAFAKGTPVIGARMGGIPELIDDGRTGYTYDATSTEDLMKKIMTVMGNKEQAMEMGLQGRDEYINKYTPESNYTMLMSIYEKVNRGSEKVH